MRYQDRSFCLRFLAALVLAAFVCQDLAFAAPAEAIRGIFSSKPVVELRVPYSVAFVEDHWTAPHATKSLILIQDAHTNESGQLNIARALESLVREEKIKHVFLEGGNGDASLSYLRAKAPLEERRRIALSYLRKGLLQGSEYLDVTSDLEFNLWGVEDEGLYAEALDAYREIARQREPFGRYLSEVKSTLEVLKPKFLNANLKSFESDHAGFRKSRIPMTVYFDALLNRAQVSGIALQRFPHLVALGEVQKKEAAINFAKASDEQRAAIAQLSEEDHALLRQAADDEGGPTKIASVDPKEKKAFYALLKEKTRGGAGYPELRKYLAYLGSAQKMDARAILEEQTALEEEVFLALILTEDERRLMDAQRALYQLESLFNLTVTPEDYSRFKASPLSHDIVRITGFLNKKIMDLKQNFEKAVFLEPGFADALAAAEKFYELTYERDRAFLKDIFEKMDETGEQRAVLITGGYHTPNLKQLLKSSGVSYISVTPQILHETDHKRYEKLLLSQKIGDQNRVAKYDTQKTSAQTISLVYLKKNPPVLERMDRDFEQAALGLAGARGSKRDAGVAGSRWGNYFKNIWGALRGRPERQPAKQFERRERKAPAGRGEGAGAGVADPRERFGEVYDLFERVLIESFGSNETLAPLATPEYARGIATTMLGIAQRHGELDEENIRGTVDAIRIVVLRQIRIGQIRNPNLGQLETFVQSALERQGGAKATTVVGRGADGRGGASVAASSTVAIENILGTHQVPISQMEFDPGVFPIAINPVVELLEIFGKKVVIAVKGSSFLTKNISDVDLAIYFDPADFSAGKVSDVHADIVFLLRGRLELNFKKSGLEAPVGKIRPTDSGAIFQIRAGEKELDIQLFFLPFDKIPTMNYSLRDAGIAFYNPLVPHYGVAGSPAIEKFKKATESIDTKYLVSHLRAWYLSLLQMARVFRGTSKGKARLRMAAHASGNPSLVQQIDQESIEQSVAHQMLPEAPDFKSRLIANGTIAGARAVDVFRAATKRGGAFTNAQLRRGVEGSEAELERKMRTLERLGLVRRSGTLAKPKWIVLDEARRQKLDVIDAILTHPEVDAPYDVIALRALRERLNPIVPRARAEWYLRALAMRRSSVSEMRILAAEARGFLVYLQGQPHTIDTAPQEQLQESLELAEVALNDRLTVAGTILDHTGAFTGLDSAPMHPAVEAPVTREEALKLRKTPDQMKRIWQFLDEAPNASIAVSLRGAVMFGFQDAGPYIDQFTPQDAQLLEDVPSLFTITSSNRVHAKVEVARRPDGTIDENKVHYENKTWGYTRPSDVPLELTPENEAPADQLDAVAYVLGLFGYHGLKITIEVDHPAMLIGGGFESSNAYNLALGIVASLLSAELGRPIGRAELFAMLRRIAPNELKDRTGLQGALAALQEWPITRHYFLGGVRGEDGEPKNPHAVFDEPVGDASDVDWIAQNSLGLMPGIETINGQRSRPRHDKWTGRMMLDLVQVRQDPQSVDAAHRMKRLVSIAHTAILNHDMRLLVEAETEYAEIRYGFQKRWFELALQAQDASHPYHDLYRTYNGDEFLRSRDPKDPDLYTGGFAKLITLGKEFGVAVSPLGKGGNGANWVIRGDAKDIQRFVKSRKLARALGVKKLKELTDDIANQSLFDRSGKEMRLVGWVPLYLGGKGVVIDSSLPQLPAALPAVFDQAAGKVLAAPSNLIEPLVELNAVQKQAIETAARIFDWDAPNLDYVTRMDRQYLTQTRYAASDVVVEGISARGQPNFKLRAGMSERRPGEIAESEIHTAEAREAARKSEKRVVKLLAGTGDRSGRMELIKAVAVMEGGNPDDIELRTKGMDFGRFERNAHGRWRFINIGIDIAFRRLGAMARSGETAGAVFEPLLNEASQSDYDQSLRRPAAAANIADVTLGQPMLAQAYPGLDAAGMVGADPDAPRAPGGSGFVATPVLDRVRALARDGRSVTYEITNGENAALPSAWVSGFVIDKGLEVAQLEATTTAFDVENTSRVGMKLYPGVTTASGDPLWVPGILEPREILMLPARERRAVQNAGQEGGFGKAGSQFHNANVFVIGGLKLAATLDTLESIIGAPMLETILTPSLIQRPPKDGLTQIDGSLPAVFERLNAFTLGGYRHPDYAFSRAQINRLEQELSLPRSTLYFIPFAARDRAQVAITIKDAAGAWFFMTDRYDLTADGEVIDRAPENPMPRIEFKTDDGSSSDAKFMIDSYGLTQTRNMKSFKVSGSGVVLTAGVFNPAVGVVDLRDDVEIVGDVEIVNETGREINFRDPKVLTSNPHIASKIDSNGNLKLQNETLRVYVEGETVRIDSVDITGSRATKAAKRVSKNKKMLARFARAMDERNLDLAPAMGTKFLRKLKKFSGTSEAKYRQYLITILSSHALSASPARQRFAHSVAMRLGLEANLHKGRVLVTGATTYLAQKTIERLLQEGYQVVALAAPLKDAATQARRERLNVLAADPRVSVVELDYAEPFGLADGFGDVKGAITHVMHFPSVTLPAQIEQGYGQYALREATYGMENLARFAKDAGAAFINVASIDIYGDPDDALAAEALAEAGMKDGKIPENFKGYSDQTDILREQHKAAEVWVSNIGLLELKVPAKLARVGFVAGPDMLPTDLDPAGPIGRIVRERLEGKTTGKTFAIGKQDSQVSVISAEEAAEGIIRLMGHAFDPSTKAADRVFNIANSNSMEAQALANLAGSYLADAGVGDARLVNEPPRESGKKSAEFMVADTERANRLLGFEAKQTTEMVLRGLFESIPGTGLPAPFPDHVIVEPASAELSVMASVKALPAPVRILLKRKDARKLNPLFAKRPSSKGVVILIGGAGFLGLNVVESYARDGYDVIILDNFSAGLNANLKRLIESDPAMAERIGVIDLDASQPFTFDGRMNIHSIHHAASLASPAFYFVARAATARTGVNIAEQANDLGQKFSVILRRNVPVLHYGTSEEYGDAIPEVQREDYLGNVSSTGPRAHYDVIAKRLLKALAVEKYSGLRPVRIVGVQTFGLKEKKAKKLSKRLNLKEKARGGYAKYEARPTPRNSDLWMVVEKPVDIRIVRISNTFGRFMRIDDQRVANNMWMWMLDLAMHRLGMHEEAGHGMAVHGHGNQNRSFLWVADQVDSIRFLADPNSDFGSGGLSVERKTLNSGADGEGSQLTIKELAQLIIDVAFEMLDVPHFDVPIRNEGWNSVLIGTSGNLVGKMGRDPVSQEEAERIAREANTQAIADKEKAEGQEKYMAWPANDGTDRYIVVEKEYRGGDDPQKRRLDTARLTQLTGRPVSQTDVRAGMRKMLLYFLDMPPLTTTAPEELTGEVVTRTYDYTKLPIRKDFVLKMFSDEARAKTVEPWEAAALVSKFFQTVQSKELSERLNDTRELAVALADTALLPPAKASVLKVYTDYLSRNPDLKEADTLTSGARVNRRGLDAELYIQSERLAERFAGGIDTETYIRDVRPVLQGSSEDFYSNFSRILANGSLERAFPFLKEMQTKTDGTPAYRYGEANQITIAEHAYDILKNAHALISGKYGQGADAWNADGNEGWQAGDKIAEDYRGMFANLNEGDREILNLAILLHDAAIVMQQPFHPQIGAVIAERVADRLGLTAAEKKWLAFLVQFHDGIGGIYIAERPPMLIARAMKSAKLSNGASHWTRAMLALIAVSEVRTIFNPKIQRGSMLTREKAQFYLDASDTRKMMRRQHALASYRLGFYASSSEGILKPDRDAAIKAEVVKLAPKVRKKLLKAFGDEILHIDYGFLVFQNLEPVTLVKLLVLLSQINAKPDQKTLYRVLSFTAPSAEAPASAGSIVRILEGYSISDLLHGSPRHAEARRALHVSTHARTGVIQVDNKRLLDESNLQGSRTGAKHFFNSEYRTPVRGQAGGETVTIQATLKPGVRFEILEDHKDSPDILSAADNAAFLDVAIQNKSGRRIGYIYANALLSSSGEIQRLDDIDYHLDFAWQHQGVMTEAWRQLGREIPIKTQEAVPIRDADTEIMFATHVVHYLEALDNPAAKDLSRLMNDLLVQLSNPQEGNAALSGALREIFEGGIVGNYLLSKYPNIASKLESMTLWRRSIERDIAVENQPIYHELAYRYLYVLLVEFIYNFDRMAQMTPDVLQQSSTGRLMIAGGMDPWTLKAGVLIPERASEESDSSAVIVLTGQKTSQVRGDVASVLGTHELYEELGIIDNLGGYGVPLKEVAQRIFSMQDGLNHSWLRARLPKAGISNPVVVLIAGEPAKTLSESSRTRLGLYQIQDQSLVPIQVDKELSIEIGRFGSYRYDILEDSNIGDRRLVIVDGLDRLRLVNLTPGDTNFGYTISVGGQTWFQTQVGGISPRYRVGRANGRPKIFIKNSAGENVSIDYADGTVTSVPTDTRLLNERHENNFKFPASEKGVIYNIRLSVIKDYQPDTRAEDADQSTNATVSWVIEGAADPSQDPISGKYKMRNIRLGTSPQKIADFIAKDVLNGSALSSTFRSSAQKAATKFAASRGARVPLTLLRSVDLAEVKNAEHLWELVTDSEGASAGDLVVFDGESLSQSSRAGFIAFRSVGGEREAHVWIRRSDGFYEGLVLTPEELSGLSVWRLTQKPDFEQLESMRIPEIHFALDTIGAGQKGRRIVFEGAELGALQVIAFDSKTPSASQQLGVVTHWPENPEEDDSTMIEVVVRRPDGSFERSQISYAALVLTAGNGHVFRVKDRGQPDVIDRYNAIRGARTAIEKSAGEGDFNLEEVVKNFYVPLVGARVFVGRREVALEYAEGAVVVAGLVRSDDDVRVDFSEVTTSQPADLSQYTVLAPLVVSRKLPLIALSRSSQTALLEPVVSVAAARVSYNPALMRQATDRLVQNLVKTKDRAVVLHLRGDLISGIDAAGMQALLQLVGRLASGLNVHLVFEGFDGDDPSADVSGLANPLHAYASGVDAAEWLQEGHAGVLVEKEAGKLAALALIALTQAALARAEGSATELAKLKDDLSLPSRILFGQEWSSDVVRAMKTVAAETIWILKKFPALPRLAPSEFVDTIWMAIQAIDASA